MQIDIFGEERFVAWNCDVCGEKLHYRKLENGKIVATQCPLEEYKTVKSYFTDEVRFLPTIFHDIPLSNDPEDLKILQSLVPETTLLSNHITKKEKVFQVRSLIASGSLRTFYLHFVRFLINFYGDNTVHYIDSHEVARSRQFNYFWLSGTLLRDCYFRNTHAQSKFKTMSDLINPSLLLYTLGDVDSIPMKNKGDLLMEVLTSRRSQGKSTWIIHTRPFTECEEIKTSENLRLHLANSSYMPQIQLDGEDPEVFATTLTNQSITSNGRGSKGNAKPNLENKTYDYF